MTAPYETPLWIQAKTGDPPVTYSGRQDRTLIDGIFGAAGVLGSSSWLVSQHAAGANFTVDVAAGLGVIVGTSIANQGKYLERTTGVANVTVTAAPGSGTRTDLIVARVFDPEADGGSTYGCQFVAVAGPDTIGTVPTVPPNAYPIAQLTIPTGLASVTSANITDIRRPAPFGSRFYFVAGTMYAGTFDPTKSTQTYLVRFSGTTDGLGFIYAALPAGVTCVMDARCNVDENTNIVRTTNPRYDYMTLSQAVFQMHDAAGTLLTSTAFTATVRIDYQ